MDFDVGYEMFTEAVRKKTDDRLFLRWCISYQTEMSFDDFKARLMPKKEEKVDEVYDKVSKIMEAMHGSF